MARKSRRSGSKKHYPVQREYQIDSDTLPSVAVELFGSIPKELSVINHRLYRQSRYYEMKVDLDPNLAQGTVVEVYALADTWFVQKAYQLAYQQFNENSQEELEMIGAYKARWNDFRVSGEYTEGGVSNNIVPLLQNNGPVAITGGEFEMTEVTDAAGVSKLLSWTGTTGATLYNIVDEYDLTGNTSSSPSAIISSVAYDGLTDEVDDAQMAHLSNDGNRPPYDENSFNNAVFYKVATLRIGSNDPAQSDATKLSTGFFTAPCGIYTLAIRGGATATQMQNNVKITVKSGDYKGVHAPSMLE
jgi:hypothetical protein